MSVKILLDSVGSSTSARHPADSRKGRLPARLVQPDPLDEAAADQQSHAPQVTGVDGRVGFTGGAGIADHWTGNAQDDDHWRDLQIRIEGPAVVRCKPGLRRTGSRPPASWCGARVLPIAAPGGQLESDDHELAETGASTVRVMYYLSISSARAHRHR